MNLAGNGWLSGTQAARNPKIFCQFFFNYFLRVVATLFVWGEAFTVLTYTGQGQGHLMGRWDLAFERAENEADSWKTM